MATGPRHGALARGENLPEAIGRLGQTAQARVPGAAVISEPDHAVPIIGPDAQNDGHRNHF